MELPKKRTLSLSIKHSDEFLEQFRTDENGTLYKTSTRNINFLNVYKMLIVEVVKEIFKQVRFESPRLYTLIQVWPVMTTILEENKKVCYLLLITDWFLKQRSLPNVLRKAYSWLNLNLPELKNVTAEQVNEVVRNMKEVFVT